MRGCSFAEEEGRGSVALAYVMVPGTWEVVGAFFSLSLFLSRAQRPARIYSEHERGHVVTGSCCRYLKHDTVAYFDITRRWFIP